MIKTTLYLPDELHQGLKIEAAQRKKSMTELIISFLQNGLQSKQTKMDSQKIKNEPIVIKSGLTLKRGEMDTDSYI